MLTLDRILGSALKGMRALILVDVEGAELAMLQGAAQTLQNDPSPIWMMEISSTEHQPSGVSVNTNLVPTFEIFLSGGYRAVTADEARTTVDSEKLRAVSEGAAVFETHNFVFR